MLLKRGRDATQEGKDVIQEGEGCHSIEGGISLKKERDAIQEGDECHWRGGGMPLHHKHTQDSPGLWDHKLAIIWCYCSKITSYGTRFLFVPVYITVVCKIGPLYNKESLNLPLRAVRIDQPGKWWMEAKDITNFNGETSLWHWISKTQILIYDENLLKPMCIAV